MICLLLTGCAGLNKNTPSQKEDSFSSFETIKEIPSIYFTPSTNAGTLEDLYYTTYESFSYESKDREITKHAIIYLPYGYSEEKKYDVFYLMHGGWSNENTTLGTPGQENALKNVIDHAISSGEIKPVIIVCPTYNNTNENGQDSDNFSLAMQLTENFHNELISDLIPAVEGKYSTFAQSTSKQDLIASRTHRSFGGFSMGSVATWRTFQYCLDYFSNFVPMSCGTTLKDDEIWQAAKSFDINDYFVFMMTGTEDFAYGYDSSRAQRALETDYFIETTSEVKGNFLYREKEGYSHDGKAAMEYTYNGMLYFFGKNESVAVNDSYSLETSVSSVISDSIWEEYGRLLFPVDSSYYNGETLGDLSLTWYTDMQPDKTVEILNYFRGQVLDGKTIFYDIYTDEEKKEDPEKENTGLFFFRGNPNGKVAICNAGGGFVFVGAIQDSFPHALELSKKGYNAFALIYRPGNQTACEDLARAIAFIYEHADELEVYMKDYSLWGGSAGARMAAWVGSYGTESFGEKSYPRPAAIIMQYTGLSEVTGSEPPTYNCVGTNDSIADYHVMQKRIDAIAANGTDTEIEIFPGLSHGFGLGSGTTAEGWINHAVAFWERQMSDS